MSTTPADHVVECPYCGKFCDERFWECPRCSAQLWTESGELVTSEQ